MRGDEGCHSNSRLKELTVCKGGEVIWKVCEGGVTATVG